MGVKEKIIYYLEEHNISACQVSQTLGIEYTKLEKGNQEELNAEEFCELCYYLNVNPKEFYTPKL